MIKLRHTVAIALLSIAMSLLPAYVSSATRSVRHASTLYPVSESDRDLHERFVVNQRRHARTTDRQRDGDDPNQGGRISRDEAAAIARDLAGGRVLKVKLKGDWYHVKLLLGGERVRIVRVNAITGRVG